MVKKLQQDVFDVLLLFQSYSGSRTDGDGVNTVKQDRQYHRLLWKGLDLSRPPEVYEAMRLMFVYPPHLALPSTLCKNTQRTTYMTIF